MSRLGILEQLQSNWPKNIDYSRIQYFESKLRSFSEADIEAGVDHVLETCKYPPRFADVFEGCRRHKLNSQSQAARKSRRFKPGDTVRGERTFTPQEASDYLEQLRDVWPDAFKPCPKDVNMSTPQDRRATLELDFTRLLVSSLRRCARMDPNKPIVAATQHDLF